MAGGCPFHGGSSAVGPAAKNGSLGGLVAELAREIKTMPVAGRLAAFESAQRQGKPLDFTTEELEWVGRIAWRNNAKCIGRLPWRTLCLLDFRGVCAPEAIAAGLKQHLATAYHGGAIRPVLSIFGNPSGQLGAGQIANRQLLGYAGFRTGPDRTVGDPANADFTDFAGSHGWAPAASDPFTLLPWMIGTRDGPGWAMMPIDRDVAHEVPIMHPTLSAVTDLRLRWYAIPAISNMSLRVAGTYFNTCVFSGWYMNTEIASRNLADEQRYNVLPLIAEKMGLDTSRARNLWKDSALLELNRAVLHSFASNGVRMVDHHSASDEFTRFCARESAAGRSVSARWDWIVPPMSPSATGVFHRPMEELITDIGFVDQPPAWRAATNFSVQQCRWRTLAAYGRAE